MRKIELIRAFPDMKMFMIEDPWPEPAVIVEYYFLLISYLHGRAITNNNIEVL